MTVIRNGSKLTPSTVRRLTERELGWVAGLLEGEGSFDRTNRSKKASLRNIRITCSMTDRDVLQRLCRIVGAGTVRGPYANRNNKPMYTVAIIGASAYDLMKQIEPEMGQRRATKIRALLRGFESVRNYVFKLQHVKSGRIETTINLAEWTRQRGLKRPGLDQTLYGNSSNYHGWRRLA